MTSFRIFSGNLSCLILLILALGFAGCLPNPANSSLSEVAEHPYESRVEDPAALALYHFGEARLLADSGDLEGASSALAEAIELDPRSAFLRLSLAELFLAMKEGEKAIRTAEDALIQDPDSVKAHLLLGNIYFSRQEDEPAVRHFKMAIELDPGQENAYLHLSVAYARAGDLQRAVEVLKDLLSRNPDSLMAEFTLARMYREMDLTVLAEEHYRNILSRRPDFGSATLDLGGMFEDKGEVQKALDVYRDALTQNSRNFGIRHHIARMFIEAEQLEQALGELTAIVELNPGDLEAYRKIGLIRLELEDWDGAAAAFVEILRQNPHIHQARFYLGTALERQGDLESALKAFGAIPPESDLYGDSLAHIGFLHHQLGRTGEAIAVIEGRDRTAVDRPEFYSYLASLYEAQGQYDFALHTLDQGMSVFPASADLPYQKGIILERTGDHEAAAAAMEEAIRIDPEHAEALNFLAYYFAEQGENLQRALEMAKRALELKNSGHIADTLGWVYFKLGRLEEARETLELAVQQLPEDPVVLEHLGDAYRRLGMPAKARAIYEKALEADAGNENVLEKLRGLDARE